MKSISKFIYVFVIITIFICAQSSAQKNVGINDSGNEPDKSAMLDISSQDKGILIPRTDTAKVNSFLSPGKPATGLMVYQNSNNKFYYFDGVRWKLVGVECVTLNDAYNCPKPGQGRIISADAGTVVVNAPATAAKETPAFLAVSGNQDTYAVLANKLENTGGGAAIGAINNSNAGYGIYSQIGDNVKQGAAVTAFNSGTDGVAILAFCDKTTNKYSTIEAHTYSNESSEQTRIAAVTGLTSGNACGLVGEADNKSTADAGVWGNHLNVGSVSAGVEGTGYVGIYGSSYDETDAMAVYSYGNLVVDQGNAYIVGALVAQGGKQFVIDHPSDPENKLLKHTCIESPEVLNVYRGNATLNSDGEAIVELPVYFNNININYSYNLTPIGVSAPGLYIKKEIANNKFEIGGGKSNMKVSWTVYAERNDLYMQNHKEAKEVEVEKTGSQKGKYMSPELYGQPSNKGMFHIRLNEKSDNLKKNRMQSKMNTLPVQLETIKR